MSMFVNTNVSSLNTRRSLLNTNVELDRSFQRLSSGFRINSASDDAAGLQISNRLTSQINGLNQATKNANDGISLAQVAEGALDEMTTMAQRMRTLVIQSRNGVNSLADKQALQREIGELNKEITRVAESTEFGGIKLLDGSLNRDFLVGANAGQTINVNLERDDGFTAESLRLSEVVVDGSEGANERVQAGSRLFTGQTIQPPFPPVTGILAGLQVSVNGSEFVTMPNVNFGADVGQNAYDFAVAILSTNLSLAVSQTDNFGNGDLLTLIGGSIRFRLEGTAPDAASAQANLDWLSNLTGIPATQLGAQAHNLYPAEAEEAISSFNLRIIDGAINYIDSSRAKLGAVQNRFQSTIRNLTNIDENLSAARSRIRDTDYAKETAELTRRQILQQAGTTVLSQANQRPQAALSLLSS